MKLAVDFKTDNSDDIYLNGDIFFEFDPGINVLKNAERRISARYDDFVLENIGAGIERFLGSRITEMTKYSIQIEISRALTSGGLLLSNEYKMAIPDIKNSRKLPVFLKFTTPFVQNREPFKVLINIENQRSYK